MKTVLIADDDSNHLFALKEVLNSEGYNCITARNGEEVLNILMADYGRVQLIILDLKMPVMDGYDALEQIKQHDEWNLIPVICITGHKGGEKAFDFGANIVLLKPISEENLLRATRS